MQTISTTLTTPTTVGIEDELEDDDDDDASVVADDCITIRIKMSHITVAT